MSRPNSNHNDLYKKNPGGIRDRNKWDDESIYLMRFDNGRKVHKLRAQAVTKSLKKQETSLVFLLEPPEKNHSFDTLG